MTEQQIYIDNTQDRKMRNEIRFTVVSRSKLLRSHSDAHRAFKPENTFRNYQFCILNFSWGFRSWVPIVFLVLHVHYLMRFEPN